LLPAQYELTTPLKEENRKNSSLLLPISQRFNSRSRLFEIICYANEKESDENRQRDQRRHTTSHQRDRRVSR
jgi:hypothetical protein